jgi:CRP-like cAMP-binding protein
MPFFDLPATAEATRDDRTFLPDATPEDWQTLLRYAGAEPFLLDQVLIKAGDPGDEFYILAEGSVQVQVPGKFGMRAIATIPAGSVFGEIAFLDNGPRTATVRALSAGTMLRVSRRTFAKLQAWEPQLAQRIALDLGRLVAVRLRTVLGRGR